MASVTPVAPAHGRESALRVKRGFDVVVAGTAMVILSPIILAVAIAVLATMGRPVLFRQVRPGKDERPFRLVKFRTMRTPRPGESPVGTDAVRVTELGKRLRRLSLDELPQLWNVLRGDMSLVGPRPLLMAYLPHFTERERIRFKVRPGITGWAQVRGRNVVSWDVRLADDVWYVENWSLWLDLRILVRTAWVLVRGADVVIVPNSVMLDLNVERTGGSTDPVERARDGR